MKKPLQDVKESTCIVGDDNIENLTQLLLERSRKYDLINNAKQQKEVEEINKSIDEFNSTKPSNQPKTSSFMKKDQVLLDLDELTEELTIEDDEGENNTDEDVDDDFGTEMINLPVNIADLRLVFSSYLPCCAHAGQLVLKDGINLDDEYTVLIKKVSKDIVSKTKVSNLIAEEVRNLELTLLTYVITRWNSILFMIRSVLRISDEDFKKIRKSMPTKTKKQLEVKSKFNINPKERAMLEELADVLTHFEWLTDNLQTNEVSISRVYPCIVSLRIKLNKEIDCMKYTKNLRKDLIASLDKRFGNLIENDLFLISTYLDPFFGPKSFPLDKRNHIKLRLKYHLGLLCPNSTNNNSFDTVAIETNNRFSNLKAKNPISTNLSIGWFKSYNFFKITLKLIDSISNPIIGKNITSNKIPLELIYFSLILIYHTGILSSKKP